MYKALYRLWRPATFDEVCGQEQVTDVLRAEIISGRISHAYLFCGSRGTGKTTCAKILAKAVNCESPVNGSPCGKCRSCLSIENGTATDVYEMDAASNNGVDSIRTLRDEVVYTPSELKYRVYIVDEVHMLSQSAFNALLKTLEEPPEYVIFILATTERHKIPATILSRCQRFDFNRVTPETIVSRLKTVCSGERITADGDALSLIAEQANGSFRDALNLLEYCAASSAASGDGTISGERARALLGSTPLSLLRDAAVMIGKKDAAGILSLLEETDRKRDVAVFMRELTGFFRNMLITSASVKPSDAGMSDEERAAAAEAAGYYNNVELLRDIDILGDAMKSASLQPRLAAELAVVKMCMTDGGAREQKTALPKQEPRKQTSVEREVPAREPGIPYRREPTDVPTEAAPAETDIPLPEEPPVTPAAATLDRPPETVKPSAQTTNNDGGVTEWYTIRQNLSDEDASLSFFLEDTVLKRKAGGYTLYTRDGFQAQVLSQSVNLERIARAVGTDPVRIDVIPLPEEEPAALIDEVIRNNTEELI